MIKIENAEVVGWEHAIRGMRNPKNSWLKSDSHICGVTTTDECSGCDYLRKKDGEFSFCTQPYIVGPNDHNLMMSLAAGGPVHAKYRRMITVYLDITAPLYWWKEFDTYKVGTVANSCSTMHKIHAKEFTREDFSYEHLIKPGDRYDLDCSVKIPHEAPYYPIDVLDLTIQALNVCRDMYLQTGDKDIWWQMIQLLPSSYNQKRTVMLNYEVLHNIYISRKNHKLDCWRDFCKWIETLPYSELITGEY